MFSNRSGDGLVWAANDDKLEDYFTKISTMKVQSRPGCSYLKGFQRFCYYNESNLPIIREQIEEEDIWKENHGGYLRNYIQYYFSRLLEERKVLVLNDSATNDVVALMWCIGLVDRIERAPLYAIAVKTMAVDQAAVCQSTGHQSPFMLAVSTRCNKVLFSANHLRSGKDSIKYMCPLTKLPPLALAHHLPLPAQFLFDQMNHTLVPGQLLMFDAYGIIDPSTAIDITHVFPDAESDRAEYETRKSRIPDNYHHLSDSVLCRRLRDGLTHAVQMAQLNPRLAVPQFFNHAVQLLLPISLDEDITNDFVPDVVLALSWNVSQKAYVVETMLTVGMAKGNARLVQRLDQDWLKTATDESASLHAPPLSSSGGMVYGAGMAMGQAYGPPGLSSGGQSGVGGFAAGLLGGSSVGNGGIMGGYEGSWGAGTSSLSLDFSAMGLDDSHSSLTPPGMAAIDTPPFGHMGFTSNHFPIGPPKSLSSGNSTSSPIGSGQFSGSAGSTSGSFPKSPVPAHASLESPTVSITTLPVPMAEESPTTAVTPTTVTGSSAAWTGPSSVAIVNAGAPPHTNGALSFSTPAGQTQAQAINETASADTTKTNGASGSSNTPTSAAAFPSSGSRRNMAWESVDWVCPQFGKDCGFGPTKCTHGPIRNGNNGWDAVDWTCPKFGKGCKFGPDKCSHK